LETNFNAKENGDLLKSIKAVVIGSPGFYKDKLHKYLLEMAEKKKSSTLKQLNSLTILAPCSTGYL
jgi:stalled ribosome rescue protein Dom34